MLMRLCVPKKEEFDYFEVESVDEAAEKAAELDVDLQESHIEVKLEPGDEGYEEAGWETYVDEEGEKLPLSDILEDAAIGELSDVED